MATATPATVKTNAFAKPAANGAAAKVAPKAAVPAAKAAVAAAPKVKKPRAPRAKARSYAESAAGHVADVINAHAKALIKAQKRISGWGNGDANAAISSAVDALAACGAELNAMAEQNFAPERKRGGGRGFKVAPGQRVFLAAEALEMLGKQMTLNGEETFFVSFSASPADKAVFVRIGGPNNTDPGIGFISKKLLSATEPVATA